MLEGLNKIFRASPEGPVGVLAMQGRSSGDTGRVEISGGTVGTVWDLRVYRANSGDCGGPEGLVGQIEGLTVLWRLDGTGLWAGSTNRLNSGRLGGSNSSVGGPVRRGDDFEGEFRWNGL